MANAPSKKIKSLNRWTATPAPVNLEEVPNWIYTELNRLSDAMFNVDIMRLEQTNVEPGTERTRSQKPRDGDIRYADGTNWSPGGSGQGIYWYDGAAWQPFGGGGGGATNLNGLSDVTLTNPTVNEVLKYDGAEWTNQPDSTAINGLDDLSDVNTTGKSTNDFLGWNGTSWVAAATSPVGFEEAPVDGNAYGRKDQAWEVINVFSGNYNDLTNQPNIPSDVSDLTDTTNLLEHFSGSYNDLTDKPNIPSDVGDLTDNGGLLDSFSGDYNDLTNKPDIVEEAPIDGQEYVRKDSGWIVNTDNQFSGDYNDLSNKPSIPSDVADLTDTTNLLDHFSGDYNDLVNQPVIPGDVGDLTDTGNLLNSGFSGDYNDLTNKPTIPTVNDARITFIQDSVEKGSFTLNQANDQDINITDFVGIGEAPVNTTTQYARFNGGWAALDVEWDDISQKPDLVLEAPIDNSEYVRKNGGWVLNTDDNFSGDYNDLTNKPNIPSDVGDLTDTGNLLDHFSGDYNDLTNTPTIPAAQVNSDWNATGTVAEILNKPVIPSDVGDLTDTGNLLDHFSGDYNDLTNQPTIPAAANNGTITINQGGVLKGTFTVDQATNTTVELDAGGAAASKTWIDYATGFSSVPSVIDTVDNTNWSEDGDVYQYTYSNGTLYRVIGATIDGFYNSFNALANPALTGLVAQKAITI